MKKLTLKEFQEKLIEIYPKENLKAISYLGGRKPAKVKCLKCGTEYIKNGENFLDKRRISICKKCFPTQANTLKGDWEPPKGYLKIGKYSGMHNKILIKCEKCGFVWNITPNNLKLGKGCPKCNKRISKGEQAILNYLNKNNIQYIQQYKIIVNNHNLFIDFYLPDLDLYIEYNGEQHYSPINFFGGEEKFQKQVYNDSLKKQVLKEKLLVISYKQFEEIDEILKSSTTILKRSTL